MIVDVQKHLQSGGIDENGDFSAEVTYKVITYYDDGVDIFSSKDKVKEYELPFWGDKHPANIKKQISADEVAYLKVTNITIETAQDDKFRNNGHFDVSQDKALLQWDYIVSYSFGETEEDGGSSSSSSSSNNSKASPSTMSISSVTYDIYDARMYAKSDTSMKNPTGICRNAINEPMYGIRKLRNLVIKFSYFARKFDYEWVTEYSGAVNKNDIVVCGIDIKKGNGLIKSLQADYDENRSRKKYKIDAEIEIAVMRPVDVEKLLGTSYKARMDFPDGSSEIDYVQFEGNPFLRQTYKNQDYTYKNSSGQEVTDKRSNIFPCDIGISKKGWGNWGSDMYQLRIGEPIILQKDGYIYDKTVNPSWDDPDLNIVEKKIAVGLDWKALDFPKSGFKTYATTTTSK